MHVTQELLETVFNMPLYRACQVLVMNSRIFLDLSCFQMFVSGNMRDFNEESLQVRSYLVYISSCTDMQNCRLSFPNPF